MRPRPSLFVSVSILATLSAAMGLTNARAQDTSCTPNPDFEAQLVTYNQEVDVLDLAYREANRAYVQAKTEYEIKHSEWEQGLEKFLENELPKENKANLLLRLFEGAETKALHLQDFTKLSILRLAKKFDRTASDIRELQSASTRVGARARLCEGSNSVFRRTELDEVSSLYQFIHSLQESASTRGLLSGATTRSLLANASKALELQTRIGEFCSDRPQIGGNWGVLTGALRTQQYVIRDLLPALKSLEYILENKATSYHIEVLEETPRLREFYRSQWSKQNPEPVPPQRAQLPEYPRYPRTEICPEALNEAPTGDSTDKSVEASSAE